MVALSSAPSCSASTLTSGGCRSAIKIGVVVGGITLLSFLVPLFLLLHTDKTLRTNMANNIDAFYVVASI